jgi:hypothetical protein
MVFASAEKFSSFLFRATSEQCPTQQQLLEEEHPPHQWPPVEAVPSQANVNFVVPEPNICPARDRSMRHDYLVVVLVNGASLVEQCPRINATRP